jgi:hypothetical protein
MSRKAMPTSHHYGKDSIGAFLAPENGYRGGLKNRGIEPKDHMKENRRDIKATEMKMRAKKDEENTAEKPLYKLAQFREVGARLYDDMDQRRPSSDQRGDFLTRGQSERRRDELAGKSRSMRADLENRLNEDFVERPSTPRKASVPKHTDVAQLAKPNDEDFIHRNRADAVTMRTKNRENVEESGIHEEFGRVPRYLEERKARWEEEDAERRRRMPDPNCPPGMTVMTEAERQQTLDMLQNSREEALQQLRRMPFVIETPSLRKKQDFLEGKLRELDNALAIFSKPKVYVAKDR